ncbi:hypothetical protein ACOSQ4_017900 [Xanthoceras sorbifolium]
MRVLKLNHGKSAGAADMEMLELIVSDVLRQDRESQLVSSFIGLKPRPTTASAPSRYRVARHSQSVTEKEE